MAKGITGEVGFGVYGNGVIEGLKMKYKEALLTSINNELEEAIAESLEYVKEFAFKYNGKITYTLHVYEKGSNDSIETDVSKEELLDIAMHKAIESIDASFNKDIEHALKWAARIPNSQPLEYVKNHATDYVYRAKLVVWTSSRCNQVVLHIDR